MYKHHLSNKIICSIVPPLDDIKNQFIFKMSHPDFGNFNKRYKITYFTIASSNLNGIRIFEAHYIQDVFCLHVGPFTALCFNISGVQI